MAKSNRFVFEYFDGRRNRKADVWSVLIELQSAMPVELAHASMGTGADISKLIELARKILDVPKWTEENDAGLTDGEMVELIEQFMATVEGEKKSTKRKPTLPVAMGPEC